MRKTPYGFVPIGAVVSLGLLILGPLAAMAVLYIATASRMWSKPAAPAELPAQCVYDQRDQPGCVGPSPEQAPTNQERP